MAVRRIPLIHATRLLNRLIALALGVAHRRPLRHRADGCQFRAVPHHGGGPRARDEPPSQSQDGVDMHLRGLGGGLVGTPPFAPATPNVDALCAGQGQETLPRPRVPRH